jgi:hypothetical protein
MSTLEEVGNVHGIYVDIWRENGRPETRGTDTYYGKRKRSRYKRFLRKAITAQ